MHRKNKCVLLFATLFMLCYSVAQAQIDTLTTITTEAEKDTASPFAIAAETATTVSLRKVPDTVAQNLRNKEEYWYVNTVPERAKPKAKKADSQVSYSEPKADWVSNLVWIILIALFVGILIWFLASSNISIFRSRAVKLTQESDVVDEETMFGLPYDSEIDKAVKAGQYRLATRLWYLYALKTLDEKGLIQFKQDRTNREYKLQLSGTSYYASFAKATRHFEYVWYGEFPVSPEGYRRIEQDFLDLKNALS